jgi:Transposase DDE domain
MPPTTPKKHMEANMQHSTTNILSVCNDIFNTETCHQSARQCGFIQRSTSKLNGHEFVKALVLPNYGLTEDSLNGLCERIREFNPKANISAPALAQRINTHAAVRFMRGCFEQLLKSTRENLEKQYSSLEGVLRGFNNIYIQDSTIFEINKKLSKYFPGTKRGGRKGGSSCKSQMKIDLIHNFTTGKIHDAQIYEGKRPDQACSEMILNVIQKEDLILRDLGYFKITSFKVIDSKGAYFLTRFPPHVKVYLNPNDQEPVDLAMHLNKHYKNKSAIDLKVWISAERFEVRLIAYRVPKNIVIERRKRAYKGAKEMGRTLSQEKLALLDFSLFVTNIPSQMVSLEVIGTIYRLRWEIELIFKTWKSHLKIDILEGLCLYRILCLIWSRLCTVILVAHITAGFLNLAKNLCKGELSPVKLTAYLLRNGTLCKAMQMRMLEDLENRMIQDMSRRFMKNKRARTTMRMRAIDSESYYEWCNCA